MFLEKNEDIEARKSTAKRWINDFVLSDFVCVSKEQKALAVICLDHRISDWLAEHDPLALKQCQDALK